MNRTFDLRGPAVAASFLVSSFLAVAPSGRAQTATVPAADETVPVPSSGDAADDAAIWIHPTVPGRSLVIGTDKDSGLAVYDLSGNQLQFLADGELNNVDLRYGFPLGLVDVALVTSGNRANNELAVYAVDPNTRTLYDVAAGSIPLGFDVYGCCMYKSPTTGDFFFIGTSDAGVVKQFKLLQAAGGGVTAQLVRTFDAGGVTEGCVADDENGYLFVAEENVGIWRYGAEPNAGNAHTLVDSTGSSGNLTADVEGLTIYYAAGGGGYLLASSQGSSTFCVYQRNAPNAYLLTFHVGANSSLGIDAVSGTDGIDVTNRGLGSAFPSGLFVVQDDSNSGGNQNFKFVDWADIAAAANPPLAVDPLYDASDTSCGTAGWTSRNGSGVNPSILASLSNPVLGSTWQGTLNCAGHAAGAALLFCHSAPSSGLILSPGEVLVDLSSVRFFTLSASHSGNTVPFNVPVPQDLRLCGVQVSLQGVVLGSPGPSLSNAIDLVLGS